MLLGLGSPSPSEVGKAEAIVPSRREIFSWDNSGVAILLFDEGCWGRLLDKIVPEQRLIPTILSRVSFSFSLIIL